MKMKIVKITVLGLCFALYFSAGAQTWNMKECPIPTSWAKNISSGSPLPEYPRPQMRRQNWQNLNGIWNYAISGNTDKAVSFKGSILVPFPLESSLSGVKKPLLPSQSLWYRRKFQKSIMKAGERCFLHFGAVDWEATVFINSKQIGIHSGGYTSFSFDITEALKDGDNELIVKVYDPTDRGIGPHGKQVLNPANIYYTPSSGIWQTVWMETVPATYIESLTITPDIDKSVVNVTVNSTADTDVKIMVADKTLRGKSNTVISMPISNVRLWSPDDPYLYDLTVTLDKDNVKSYFGMRKISIGKDEKGFDRIMLNNKYTYNLGTLDQGFWPDGLYTAPTDEALQFDIKAIKSMGFNTIRKHIKVEPARWYYHADRLGMLVWQDLVNPNQALPEGSKQQFEKESAEIVRQLHNYPSITTWVLFNEKWGQFDQERLTKWLKQADPSRLVNGHSGEYLYVSNQLRSPSTDAYIGADMTDVHAYPDPMMPVKQQGKAQVLGEFGGIGVPIEGHLWDDLITGWGYDGIVTPAKMKIQYSQMIDSLVKLEKQGLSASIYTQTFDVESEQNGIITYDRKVLKLPLAELRAINSKLLSQSKLFSYDFGFELPDTSQNSYSKRIADYQSGKRDSSFLRNLLILTSKKDDADLEDGLLKDYINQLVDPFKESNLKFLKYFVKRTDNPAFNLFFNNVVKINKILGKDEAEQAITRALELSLIKQQIKDTTVNWKGIRNSLRPYGDLGREVLLQEQVIYSLNHNDLVHFVRVAKPWFKRYGEKRKWIADGFLNSVAWNIFEKSNNRKALKIALLMSKKSLLDDPNEYELDTYGNLLYKLGFKSKAIYWQKKAAAVANVNNTDNQKNLEKMLANLPTWPEKKE